MRKKEKTRRVINRYTVDQAKARHAGNRAANELAAADNRFLRTPENVALLAPQDRGRYTTVKGERVKVQPFTNKGNGSPTRPSQLKRAVARKGLKQKVS